MVTSRLMTPHDPSHPLEPASYRGDLQEQPRAPRRPMLSEAFHTRGSDRLPSGTARRAGLGADRSVRSSISPPAGERGPRLNRERRASCCSNGPPLPRWSPRAPAGVRRVACLLPGLPPLLLSVKGPARRTPASSRPSLVASRPSRSLRRRAVARGGDPRRNPT